MILLMYCVEIEVILKKKKNCMSQHGFIPVISRPTRITDHSMTLIDIFSQIHFLTF